MNENPVLNLLEAAERLLALPVCFHDRTGRIHLPREFAMHRLDACTRVKERDAAQSCMRYAMQEIPGRLTGIMREECPGGFLQFMAPVGSDGFLDGVLFVGPCWARAGKPPYPDLPVLRDRRRQDDIAELTSALAAELSRRIRSETGDGYDFRRQVLEFLQHGTTGIPTLAELARHVAKSPSRTGHRVTEVFGMPFTQLVHAARARQAAQWLIATDDAAGAIAQRLGYCNQAYFCKRFREVIGCTPQEYRRANRRDP